METAIQRKRFLRMSLEKARNHLDHEIRIDYGIDDKKRMEYTLWCITCNQMISDTIKEPKTP